MLRHIPMLFKNSKTLLVILFSLTLFQVQAEPENQDELALKSENIAVYKAKLKAHSADCVQQGKEKFGKKEKNKELWKDLDKAELENKKAQEKLERKKAKQEFHAFVQKCRDKYLSQIEK